MAQIDSEINLVRLRDVKLSISLLLHENSHKLITNLRSVLSVVSQAKLFSFHSLFKLRFFLNLEVFTLNFFGPT